MPNALSPRDFRPDIGHERYHHKEAGIKDLFSFANFVYLTYTHYWKPLEILKVTKVTDRGTKQ